MQHPVLRTSRRLPTLLCVVGTVLAGVVAFSPGATPSEADGGCTPTADVATGDAGYVNPWAAGDAAVHDYLADLGRAQLVDGGRPPESIGRHDRHAGIRARPSHRRKGARDGPLAGGSDTHLVELAGQAARHTSASTGSDRHLLNRAAEIAAKAAPIIVADVCRGFGCMVWLADTRPTTVVGSPPR